MICDLIKLHTDDDKGYSSLNITMVEKLRSILQRGKARDYYDVWRLLKEKDFDQGKIGELLIETSKL
ncbi:MAG: hypothetical protein GQ533_04495 [Methanosarcinaceae archaeon]|nr:hypothetical protein [Methanosarcinaceae archaeon]